MNQEEYLYDLTMNYDGLSTDNSVAEQLKRQDRGYTRVRVKTQNSRGKWRTQWVDAYASNGTGSHIRDAETGDCYPYLVGSTDEDSFFKVSMSTGKCNGTNGLHTFFYLSPQHYESHLNCELNTKTKLDWYAKTAASSNKKNSKTKPVKQESKQNINIFYFHKDC